MSLSAQISLSEKIAAYPATPPNVGETSYKIVRDQFVANLKTGDGLNEARYVWCKQFLMTESNVLFDVRQPGPDQFGQAITFTTIKVIRITNLGSSPYRSSARFVLMADPAFTATPWLGLFNNQIGYISLCPEGMMLRCMPDSLGIAVTTTDKTLNFQGFGLSESPLTYEVLLIGS